jgi:peptide/nickel transport system substrate-binding protein
VLLVGMNHEKKPWSDKRARRALTLALDRYQASQALSRIAIVKSVGGVQVPGTPFATPPEELEKLAGYAHDVAKARAEARRLLKEAGVPEGFAFSLKNRNVPMPYEPVAVWLVDQWRQVGLQAQHEFIESTKWEADLRTGDYEVAVDTQCSYAVDPDLDLYKFQSMGISHNNYGRYTDKVLDELYERQSRALDPDERRKYVREFERRLLDEETHYLYTLQWHRIVPHNAKVRGWTITPSHFVNNQLDTVWLAE